MKRLSRRTPRLPFHEILRAQCAQLMNLPILVMENADAVRAVHYRKRMDGREHRDLVQSTRPGRDESPGCLIIEGPGASCLRPHVVLPTGSGIETCIDTENRARDQIGSRTCQKRNGTGDFAGLAETAKRGEAALIIRILAIGRVHVRVG
jgi:hypothetical protein